MPEPLYAPLSAGQLDVGGSAPSAGLGNAFARGLTLKLVADKASICPASAAALKDRALYDKLAMPGLNPNGRVNLAAIERYQEYFLRSGKQSQRVDYARHVDNSFADWAAQQLGEYR